MSTLQTLRAGLSLINNWIIYICSFLVPRDPRLWAFVGWRKNKDREVFCENPKYLLLYVKQHDPRIRCVWIGADEQICKILRMRGYEAHSIHSWKGMALSLRAGYTFLGAFIQPLNWRLSGGTRLVQLWHGKSVKKTGYNSPYSLKRYNRLAFPHLFTKYDYFVGVSEYLAKFTAQDFHVPQASFLISGAPKNDILTHDIQDADIDQDTNLLKTIEETRALAPKKLLLYGPTFRPGGMNPLNNLLLDTFDVFLREHNYFVIITLHPKFSTKDWIPDARLTNIRFSQGDADIYPLLSRFDGLITDYSSLIMDFLYMDKPVIHFAPDFHTYQSEMGVYEELWSLMPGPKSYTFKELVDVLPMGVNQPSKARMKARDTLFPIRDGKACERIHREIQGVIFSSTKKT